MIALGQSLKAVIHIAGFSTMSQYRISKRGRYSVMHQPITETDAHKGAVRILFWADWKSSGEKFFQVI